MQIKWKIVKKNPEQGCVEVLWRDADSGIEIGPLNVYVLDETGVCPQGAALEKIIHGYTPLGQFDREIKAAAQAEAGMDHVDALVGVEKVADLNVFVTQAQVVTPDPVADLVTVQVQ